MEGNRLSLITPLEDYRALYQCSCGNLKIARSYNVKRGVTRSCGCLNAEVASARGKLQVKHGGSSGGVRSAIYCIYRGMLQRCYDKNYPGYKNYGGRGITVSPDWRNDFLRFVSDMGPRPSPEHSVDRIDFNGPYSKDNCRWADRKTQATNRRATIQLTHQGETLCAFDWAHKLGIAPSTMYKRIRLFGTDYPKLFEGNMKRKGKR